jgi:hypothetical protein
MCESLKEETEKRVGSSATVATLLRTERNAIGLGSDVEGTCTCASGQGLPDEPKPCCVVINPADNSAAKTASTGQLQPASTRLEDGSAPTPASQCGQPIHPYSAKNRRFHIVFQKHGLLAEFYPTIV